MNNRFKPLYLIFPAIFLYTPVSAAINNPEDSDAGIVLLRTSCLVDGQALKNCFDDTSSLTNWVTTTRVPTAASPLKVDIGPGSFPRLVINCGDGGHTTFTGSGATTTILKGAAISACTEVEFNDITFGPSFIAVQWVASQSGGNTSRWNNVVIDGAFYGWYESKAVPVCTDGINGNAGKHYWNNSRIIVDSDSDGQLVAYRDGCGSENWFFGSELIAREPNTTVFRSEITGFTQDGEGDTHFYGSVVRVLSSLQVLPDQGSISCTLNSGATVIPSIRAICATQGEVHIHGTGIDTLSHVDNDVAALIVGPTAHFHANNAAYNMQAGAAGTLHRIVSAGGMVKAPYDWESGILSKKLVSQDGKDSTTELVCTNPPSCTINLPHSLIYTTQCSDNGPWFDSTINQCRQ